MSLKWADPQELAHPASRLVSRGFGLRQGECRTNRQGNIRLFSPNAFRAYERRGAALRPSGVGNACLFEPILSVPFQEAETAVRRRLRRASVQR